MYLECSRYEVLRQPLERCLSDFCKLAFAENLEISKKGAMEWVHSDSPAVMRPETAAAGRALRKAALRFYAAARVARYEAGASAAQLELNRVPPLQNDGEFPRLGAGSPTGPAGPGARGVLGGPGPVGTGSGATAGKAIFSGRAKSGTYRATGRRASVGGAPLSGIPRASASQMSSDGVPAGYGNWPALSVGTIGESPAL